MFTGLLKLIIGVCAALLIVSNTALGLTLHETVREGNLEAISETLERDSAALDRQDRKGLAAIHIAARKNNVEALELLLDEGADVEQRDKWGRTALHLAALEGNVITAEMLLEEQARTDISERTRGYTPLHMAARNGHSDMVELLIREGARTEAKTHSFELTPLQLAVRGEKSEVIDILIKLGANVNEPDKLGRRPLHFAAEVDNTGVSEDLLSHGASPDTRASTPLYPNEWFGRITFYHGQLVIPRQERKGIDEYVYPQYQDARTPLHTAGEYGNQAATNTLLGAGGSPNAIDADSFSPTLLAAVYGYEDVARTLWEAGGTLFAERQREILDALLRPGNEEAMSIFTE